MKFSCDYTVYDHDVDINGILSVSAIMRYIQEAASLQHLHYGPQICDLRDDGKAFILSRASLDVLGSPVRSNEKITATTWLNNARGFGFTRYTELSRGGETVARMNAFWGVIDLNTRRPLRVEDVPLGFDTDEDSFTVEAPSRFRPSKEAVMNELGEFKVTYRDCDENVHLNNTNYAGIFCGLLPSMQGKRVSQFSINYMHEARLGSSFKIYGGEFDGAYIFKTELDSGEQGAEARLTLTDIL